jgi:hypothetical protein
MSVRSSPITEVKAGTDYPAYRQPEEPERIRITTPVKAFSLHLLKQTSLGALRKATGSYMSALQARQGIMTEEAETERYSAGRLTLKVT